ncbi:MAG: alkaline phosphatase, partial [Akkermansiaceae bacterium]|nr:alkaline phosphatase [Akkermansiaceae bacterium]
PGPRYHVIGNHDTDGGYQREQTVAWWKMTARYYSFDHAGTHFVVLDGNDR